MDTSIYENWGHLGTIRAEVAQASKKLATAIDVLDANPITDELDIGYDISKVSDIVNNLLVDIDVEMVELEQEMFNFVGTEEIKEVICFYEQHLKENAKTGE